MWSIFSYALFYLFFLKGRSFKKYLFIYVLAASGLSCGMRDIRCGMQASLSSCGAQALEHVGSVVVDLVLSSCSTQV